MPRLISPRHTPTASPRQAAPRLAEPRPPGLAVPCRALPSHDRLT